MPRIGSNPVFDSRRTRKTNIRKWEHMLVNTHRQQFSLHHLYSGLLRSGLRWRHETLYMFSKPTNFPCFAHSDEEQDEGGRGDWIGVNKTYNEEDSDFPEALDFEDFLEGLSQNSDKISAGYNVG
ncbi:hypothetical protein B0H17DRAFT_1135165 [Mycena rosella]|uniref:Uncharacterized protein n=1 Tax=Mycena rosella TaxID=1033263 RepID=A0AAD7GHD4_MYCRO|nr:hypothetical protein B0H17DRAFT_1135165 [Mycena rosella]